MDTAMHDTNANASVACLHDLSRGLQLWAMLADPHNKTSHLTKLLYLLLHQIATVNSQRLQEGRHRYVYMEMTSTTPAARAAMPHGTCAWQLTHV